LQLYNLYPAPVTVRRMNGNMKNSCKIWVKVREGKRPLGRHGLDDGRAVLKRASK
jgi:hypothetical protein